MVQRNIRITKKERPKKRDRRWFGESGKRKKKTNNGVEGALVIKDQERGCEEKESEEKGRK